MMFIAYSDREGVVKRDTRLRLMQCGDGVKLVACREDGSSIGGADILHISGAGELSLSSYINTDLGLKLDGNRRLVVN